METYQIVSQIRERLSESSFIKEDLSKSKISFFRIPAEHFYLIDIQPQEGFLLDEIKHSFPVENIHQLIDVITSVENGDRNVIEGKAYNFIAEHNLDVDSNLFLILVITASNSQKS
jgi:hypothetical protein